MSGEDLVAEARRLDGEARGHKGAIARHRAALQEVRSRQAAIEEQCAALGIAVVYVPPSSTPGEGDSPWPPQTQTPRSSTSRR